MKGVLLFIMIVLTTGCATQYKLADVTLIHEMVEDYKLGSISTKTTGEVIASKTDAYYWPGFLVTQSFDVKTCGTLICWAPITIPSNTIVKLLSVLSG